MFAKRTLVTSDNLNNAFISKTDTAEQTVSSDLKVGGGKLTLKNTFFTDNASAGYLRIDPQGNNVIIYDGVNNQQLNIHSSSGSEALTLQTINGTTSYASIDVSSAVNHLKIMNNTGKHVEFGGPIILNSSATVSNPANASASVILGWISNDPRIRIGGSGTGSAGTFRIQGTSDIDRMTLDSNGNGWFKGTVEGTTLKIKNINSTSLTTGNLQLINATSGDIYVGNPSTKLNLESNANPTVNIAGTVRTMYHTGNFDPNTKYDKTGGTLTGDVLVSKNNAWITAQSSGSGANGVEQGAGVSIGESGYKGSAALHLTYTGDGYGHIGMGSVDGTTGIPANKAMELFYTNNKVKFMATPNVNGSDIWHAGTFDKNNINLSSGSFVLPVRTSDPTSPAVGQMWLRSDL